MKNTMIAMISWQGSTLDRAWISAEDGVRLHGLELANMGFHDGSGVDFSEGLQTSAKLSPSTEDTEADPSTKAWAYCKGTGSKMQENCSMVGAPRRSQHSK